MVRSFSIKQALKCGFGLLFDHLGLIILIALTYLGIFIAMVTSLLMTIGVSSAIFLSQYLPQLTKGCETKEECADLAQIFATALRDLPWIWIIVLVSIYMLINFALGIGYIRVAFDLHDTGTSRWARLFSGFAYVPKVFAASILYVLMVAVGLLLLIVPGIYLAIRYGLFAYFIIDKNAGIFESFTLSGNALRGNVGWWLLLEIALMAIAAITKPIALLIALPVAFCARVHAYRRLTGSPATMTEHA